MPAASRSLPRMPGEWAPYAAGPDSPGRRGRPGRHLTARPPGTWPGAPGGRAGRPGRFVSAVSRRVAGEEDGEVSFWKPAENPRTRPPRSWALDCGCAIVAGAASLAHFSFGQTGHPVHLSLATGAIVAIASAAALPLRRVWPGPVFGWTLLVTAALAQWPDRGALFPVALGISLYTVAAMMRRAEALTAAALVAGVTVLVVAQGGTSNWALAIADAAGYAAAAAILGLYVGTRRAYLAALRDRAGRLERERDQSSALAAAEERARIAREMHDSVAHHLTVIVALSDGALRAVTRAPGEAADAIADVSGTARQALAETRRLLGVLRADAGGQARQPLPGLADLDDLLGRVRAAGLPVRYERTGTGADLPSGIQLAVFRLVQEALTNTMKHGGPGASAAVRLQLTPAEVHVEVEDDGARPGAGPAAGGGGLIGMRERISAFGGELDYGPRHPRGWRVTARLSLDPAAAS
jgi:signal transduction histidine kinase